MPETEPITVKFQADTSGLVTGINEGKAALNGFGREADSTGTKITGLEGRNVSLFRTFLIMRGATASLETVMKRLGIATGTSTAIMEGLNLVLSTGVAILAVYRAAMVLNRSLHITTAIAAAWHAIAEAGVVVPIVGIGIAAAALFGAWAIANAMSPREAQFGGVFMPRPGGTIVRLAEAGRPEAVVPLGRGGFGGGGDINVSMNVYTNDPDELVRVLGRRIQTLKQAGY